VADSTVAIFPASRLPFKTPIVHCENVRYMTTGLIGCLFKITGSATERRHWAFTALCGATFCFCLYCLNNVRFVKSILRKIVDIVARCKI